MSAHYGAPDLERWALPLPRLLREVTGIEPASNPNHVRLDDQLGIRSVQRLALADVGGQAIAGLWPAELKAQALYLYAEGRAQRMISAARGRQWQVVARPHLAFFNAPPALRLYMEPEVSPEAYAERWEGPDAEMVGRHPNEKLPAILAWLELRGYVAPGDGAAVGRFRTTLGRRSVDVRAGLMMTRAFNRAGITIHDLAAAIRHDLNEILGSADEPRLS
jgi:hypothetical protein